MFSRINTLLFTALILLILSGCASPLHVAVAQNDVQTTKNLIAQGEDINDPAVLSTAIHKRNPELVRVVLEAGADPNGAFGRGVEPIIIAVNAGDVEIVEMLIAAGADVEARNELVDRTALLQAVINADEDVVRALLEGGANPNAKSADQVTALQEAAATQKSNLVEVLLEYDADPDMVNSFDYTALFYSVKANDLASIEAMIKNGANVNFNSVDFNTPLILATEFKNDEAVKLLLDNQADPNLRSDKGAFPLVVAVIVNTTEIAEILISSGADVNRQNHHGVTPLILAAQKGHMNMVELFLESGADPTVKAYSGVGPVDAAIQNGHHNIASILNKAIAASEAPIYPATPVRPQPKQEEYAVYTGTGWLTHGGYVITNYHVVEGHSNLVVRFNSSDDEIYPAQVKVSDRHNDLAILEIESENKVEIPGIPISTAQPKLGQEVFTIGYPKTSVMGKNAKVTDGIISALSGIQDDPRIIQTTVAIQSGNSGGPLLNMEGEAIGVTTATLRAQVTEEGLDIPQGVNYAVKSAYVTALLSSLPQKGGYRTVPPSNSKLEDIIPKIDDAIVQVIVRRSN